MLNTSGMQFALSLLEVQVKAGTEHFRGIVFYQSYTKVYSGVVLRGTKWW